MLLKVCSRVSGDDFNLGNYKVLKTFSFERLGGFICVLPCGCCFICVQNFNSAARCVNNHFSNTKIFLVPGAYFLIMSIRFSEHILPPRWWTLQLLFSSGQASGFKSLFNQTCQRFDCWSNKTRHFTASASAPCDRFYHVDGENVNVLRPFCWYLKKLLRHPGQVIWYC